MKIIINADDFGMSNRVNEAIIQLFDMELLDRCSVMVNMPGVEKLINNDEIKLKLYDKIGLHLNLTEGKPLTNDIADTFFCNNQKYMSLENVNLFNRIYLNTSIQKKIVKEIEAQMCLFRKFGFTLNHLDSHNYSSGDYSICKLVIPLAMQYGFTSIRLAKNIKSTENNGMKYCYRHIVNLKIKDFNKRYLSAQASDLFGSLHDLNEYFEHSTDEDKTIELMVHPYLREDGVIIDHYTHEELLEPLKRIRSFK